MIIKILTRKTPSYNQLLEYITKDNKGFVITHNLKGNKIKDWVKQYQENETFRKNKRKDSILLTHEIVSFGKKDTKNLSIEKMEILTREYIRLRNPRAMVTAVSHHDKDHFHVHLAISALEYKTGKSMRLSKTDLSKLKKDFQNYQIEMYPELSSSIVKHGKGGKSITDAEFQLKMRDKRMTDKEQVLEILNTCFKNSKSKDDFFLKLKERGLTTYMRSGKMTGIVFKNKKHRLARLGYDNTVLQGLDKTLTRERDLGEIRKTSKERDISHDKNITR
jgi:Relaxase/Mobilisation nuclease domain